MDLAAIDEMYEELASTEARRSSLKDTDLKIEKIKDAFRQHCMKKKSTTTDKLIMDEALVCSLKDMQEKCLGILAKYKDLNTVNEKQGKNSYADISELVHDINLQKENVNFNAWLHETIVTSFFEN